MIVVARRGCGWAVSAAAADAAAIAVEVNVRKRIFVNANKCRVSSSHLAAAVVLWGLHRFLTYAEDRGWIYYRKKRGSYGGLGVTSNFLNMYDPSRKHLQQVRARRGVEARRRR